MKSPTKPALDALKLLANDFRDALPDDAAILKLVVAELSRAPVYLLPKGGEVDRNALLGSTLPLERLRFPHSSLALQFFADDTGYNPSETHIVPLTSRMALVQDLSDARLHDAWTRVLDPFQPNLSPDSLLILPINAIRAPGAAKDSPGNRGWMLGWCLAHLKLSGESGAYQIVGAHPLPMIKTTVPWLCIPMGILGVQELATYRDSGTVDNEFARETMLECAAALDLALAVANNTAQLRRSPTVEGNAWLAGKGPRAAPKPH